MPPGGQQTQIGPFTKGLNNATGFGEMIDDAELYECTNLEVDLDGSLVNRPSVNAYGGANLLSSTAIGIYAPPNTNNYKWLVANREDINSTVFVNTTTLAVDLTVAVKAVCGVQFMDRWYMCTQRGAGTGGYATATTGGVLSWVPVAAIPFGDSMTVYLNRLWVAGGFQDINITTPTTDAFLYWSMRENGNLWDTANDGGAIAIGRGDGQHLVAIFNLNNDIICLKEHSTYRYNYTTNPNFATTSKISNVIGCINYNSAAVYDNNAIYTFHGGAVWELYNFNYSKVSEQVRLRTNLGVDNTFQNKYVCLSIFRDRLFFRFWSTLYVYSLTTKTWSLWTTARDFDKVVTLFGIGSTPDRAIATPSGNTRIDIYWFNDDHFTNVAMPTGETFTCSIRTKLFDFDAPWSYKVLMYWGIHIATAGIVSSSVNIPNAYRLRTWGESNQTSWADAAITKKWGLWDTMIEPDTSSMSVGIYGRRYLKMMKKLRFRQAYWKFSTPTVANNSNDACVRIYHVVPVLKLKETVVKQVT